MYDLMMVWTSWSRLKYLWVATFLVIGNGNHIQKEPQSQIQNHI